MPRNIKYHPKKNVYEVGDVITCSVESQPPSKYTWFDNNRDVVSNSSSVIVGSDMGWMSCVASNEHGNMSINVSYGELIVFEFELEFLDLMLMLENFNIINMIICLTVFFVCELILD